MDNKPSFRTKKIELSIKRLVSEYLVTHRDYLSKFPNLRFEITSVKVSKDLRFAKIFLIHNVLVWSYQSIEQYSASDF